MNATDSRSREPPQPDALREDRCWVESDGVHIDVRGLSPPAPLVQILMLVESIRDVTPVIVHHDREPMLLYGELAELGWTSERIDAPPGEVRLRLERGR
jgi:hypothetical protein